MGSFNGSRYRGWTSWSARKRKPAKSRQARKFKVHKKAAGGSEKRRRDKRPFPATPFEEALEFARELFKLGVGQPVKRLTLFNILKKALAAAAAC